MSTLVKKQELIFAESNDLSQMQAMVANGTVKNVNREHSSSLPIPRYYSFDALMYQCYHHDIAGALERVRFLLLGCDPPANPNNKSRHGPSGFNSMSLHWAIYKNCEKVEENPDLMQLLLENGADCSRRDIHRFTALDLAKNPCYKSSKSFIVICNWYRTSYEDILYLNDTADLPSKLFPVDDFLLSILKEVISRGRVLSFLILLNHKSSYDGFFDSLEDEFRDELLESLMHAVMSVQSNDQIRKFADSWDLSYMQAKVADGSIYDVNAVYYFYYFSEVYDSDTRKATTALLSQCSRYDDKTRRLERVRFLLKCNPPANPNKIDPTDGCTALHCAISCGNEDDPDLVKLLLEYGADCTIKGMNSKNALALANDKYEYNKCTKSIPIICDWYRNKYEDILYVDDLAEIPPNLQPSDSLLEDVLKEVISRGRVLSLLMLLNHKSSYDGFVDSLEYDFREDMVESLILEMLQ